MKLINRFRQQFQALRRQILARWRVSLALFYCRDGQPLKLVYQMGKVGSSSVIAGLRQAGLQATSFQIHFLSNDINVHKKTHRDAGHTLCPVHLLEGQQLRTRVVQKKIPVKVISLVRDPVAVFISNLFQNPLLSGFRGLSQQGHPIADAVRQEVTQKILAADAFDYINNWFDREMRQVFGIDVFEQPFCKQTGWQVYRSDRAELLLLQLEKLDDEGWSAISTYCSHDVSRAVKNSRVASPHGQLYDEILNTVKFNEKFLTGIYSSKFASHFYSEEDLNTFRQKWQRGI